MNHTLTIEYAEYASIEELTQEDAHLLVQAQEASHNAYAPFSQFSVGAAIRLSNGMVLKGNNQENAAFPAGTCAERSVLFYALANYPSERVEAIAITAYSKGNWIDTPASPCGVCRQALLESEVRGGQPIRVILGSSTTITVFKSIRDLLPFGFDALK